MWILGGCHFRGKNASRCVVIEYIDDVVIKKMMLKVVVVVGWKTVGVEEERILCWIQLSAYVNASRCVVTEYIDDLLIGNFYLKKFVDVVEEEEVLEAQKIFFAGFHFQAM